MSSKCTHIENICTDYRFEGNETIYQWLSLLQLDSAEGQSFTLVQPAVGMELITGSQVHLIGSVVHGQFMS